MIPGLPVNEARAVFRLSRTEQLDKAQADAREDAAALGHELSAWRTAGMVADDEATCLHCRRAVFLVYGNTANYPLAGLRRSGTALQMPCDPPKGGGRVKFGSAR